MKSTTSTAVLAAAGAAALVLSLAACSGGEPGESPESTPEAGPLDKYFEQMNGGEFDEGEMNAQQMEVEEIVAACMIEQGFEYIPVDWSAAGSGPVAMPDDLDVEWGTIEFAEKYGYGATTDPYGDQSSQPEDGSGEEFVDPNQEYVDAMSETEREAYYAALYGEPPTEEEMAESDSGEMEYNWEDSGCSGKAQHEVYEMGGEGGTEDFSALQDDMSAMWEASMADPRLTGLNDEWASCMTEAGYSGMAAVGDGENKIYEEVNALWEDAYADAEADPSKEMTEEDYKAIEESIEEDRKAITPREIEMAVADFTCRDEIRYDEIQQEVNFEYQQEFVDAHKDELEAWVESEGTSGAKG